MVKSLLNFRVFKVQKSLNGFLTQSGITSLRLELTRRIDDLSKNYIS